MRNIYIFKYSSYRDYSKLGDMEFKYFCLSFIYNFYLGELLVFELYFIRERNRFDDRVVWFIVD